MSDTPLPKKIDFFRSAKEQRQVLGYLEVEDLPRFGLAIDKLLSPVDVVLRFDRDRNGQFFLTGQLTADCQLVCQRCLEPFSYRLESRLNLGFASTEKYLQRVDKDYDPCLVSQGEQILAEVLEDELILSLPSISAHKPACRDASYVSGELADAVDLRKNPFADLASMMGKETD